MTVKEEAIRGEASDAVYSWLVEHEVSFPRRLEQAIKDTLYNWLDEHSEELMKKIADRKS